MDKLQPILKNHFWILLVPLLSMNLWGYFSANGALKAATSARESGLDQVKGGIPAGTTDANAKYAEELKKRNDILEKYVNEELLDLWNRQKSHMVWPPLVAADIPKVYRSEIKDNRIRFNYQKEYPDVIRQLHERVEPFVAEKRGITWTPKVDFPIQLIPQVQLKSLAIESKDMWNAQEDIWVTQFILDAIRHMNVDADSATSAVVRRVIEYRLLGGDGQAVLEGAESGGGEEGGSMMDSMAGAYGNAKRDGGGVAGGGAFGASGGGAQSSRVQSSIKFNPAEEFGPGGEPVNTGGQGGGAGGGSLLAAASAMSMTGDEGGGEATESEEPTGPLRYVNEVEDAPFVERGFYLSVIMNQNKVVDFLVALANSEWPVRVVRFHIGKNPYAPDPFNSKGAGSAGSGGGMAGMRMGRGGRGGIGQSAAPLSALGGGDDDFRGKGMSAGRPGGASAMGMSGGGAANTGYPPDALQHPDLVQLDLAGVMTMYRQPKSEIPEVGASEAESSEDKSTEEPSAEEPSTADNSKDATATGDPASDSTAPATDGEMPAEAPVGESGEAATDPATGETPAENPAEESAPAEETPAAENPSPDSPVPAEPASEGTPDPAPEETDPPAADPAAVSPPATETPAPDAEVPEAAQPEAPAKP